MMMILDLEDPSNQLIEKLGHHQSLTICSHIDLRDDDDDDSYHNGKRAVYMDNVTMSRNPPHPGLQIYLQRFGEDGLGKKNISKVDWA